ILAASQADDFAIENGALRQGLLTYALVCDGLDRNKADFRPKNGNITLGEWLAYATERVPELHELIAENRIAEEPGCLAANARVVLLSNNQTKVSTRNVVPDSETRPNSRQTPALFDYSRSSTELVI